MPFCQSKCLYCDFSSFAGLEDLFPAYLEALKKEVKMLVSPEMEIATVFVGGGTPTLLSGSELKSLLIQIGKSGQFLPDVEITVEANPNTLDLRKLELLRAGGANRLSLGVQSSQDRILAELGRRHTVYEAMKAFSLAREAGFTNINIDLIFGAPGQTLQDWEQTLKWAIEMGPEHLSCYGLQLEEGVPLTAKVAAGAVVLPSEDETAKMYHRTLDLLAKNGYFQYEISNFARKDYQCRHNLFYWRYREYLGLGSAAYSFQQGERRANEETPAKYIDRIRQEGSAVAARERISRRLQMAEMIMLGLRLETGPDPEDFLSRWGVSLESILEPEARKYREGGFLEGGGGSYHLTRQGKLVSNRVIGGLLANLL